MSAAVSSIVIERAWNSVRITVHTARPGLVIGRKGEEIEKIRQYLQGLCGASTQVNIDIVEIRSPETDAQLIAENVAVQLERRVSFRRAMKRAVQVAMERGARRHPHPLRRPSRRRRYRPCRMVPRRQSAVADAPHPD